MDKLSNLHLLLRGQYFSKWPLEIRFFNEEVHRLWETWCGRVDAQLRPGIQVQLDLPQSKLEEQEEEFSSAQPQPSQKRKRKADLIGKGGVEGVDPTYARLRGVFEKSEFLLDDDDDQKCSICAKGVDTRNSLFIVCHTDTCQGVSHVTCLADASLDKSASQVVPETATCPICKEHHPWLELMQQVTLRNRAAKEIKKLLAKKGKKSTAAVAAEIMETESEDSDAQRDEDVLTAKQVVDEEAGLSSGDDDNDNRSVASADSFLSRASDVSTRAKTKSATDDRKRSDSKLEIVIEDSEDER